ncbi:MAG: hypothetical protein BWY77_01168 [bacterium ADurb.Bin431]|jgi:hypothetical protein|nr:MAG: hypothetical protein BWY77_01168 [bacterium ADurb.Bin431]HNY90435.1 PorV/PorQ family protein [bacterium]HOC24410.1 PorV/PorQ family protein [bacterium]HOH06161.1 PorV/PorQ family protein [bacterium]HOY43218.1 PorV/PorQ family protein [bacterium]
MNGKITRLLFVFLMTAGPILAFEKVGTTAFQFLKVPASARGCAMGEAFSAAADHSDAAFFNPAALTRIRKMDISFDYMDYFLDISHVAVSGAWSVPNLGTFGLHAIATDIGSIRVTSVEALDFYDGVYLGYTGETIEPGSALIGASFARDLTDKFAFGLSAKYAREDLGVRSAGTLLFDGGLTYDTGFMGLQIAAAIRHFGPEVKFYDQVSLPRYDASTDSTYYQRYNGKGYPLPQTFNIGMAAWLISASGHSLIHSRNQTLLLAFDLVQPRDYDQQYNFGLEYGFEGLLFLRAGYKLNYDTEGLSLGFGLAWNRMRIDYAYSDYGAWLDAVHRFTFGFVVN